MATKQSMRNVLSPVDPTSQGGSLAGTMVPASSTVDITATQRASQPQTQGQASQSPDYDALDQHEPLSEDDWYQLLHNLGSAMQKANPDIQKVLQDMSPQIDYEGQAAKLRQAIEARKTPQAMGWLPAAVASASSPAAAQLVEQRQQAARAGAAQKQTDLESLQEQITGQHIQDLQRRGKFQEALATMLLQKGIGEAQAREKNQMMLQREKLRGENAVNSVRMRASQLADTFHFDERMRLKLLDLAGRTAMSRLQKYGSLDPVTGGFTIKPEDYEKWQDETMGDIYQRAAELRHGGIPEEPGSTLTPPKAGEKPGQKPATSHGQVGAKKGDPLGIR